MLMIAAAIMLIIYTTSAAMLSPKSPQSIHKIPDAIHNLSLIHICLLIKTSVAANKRRNTGNQFIHIKRFCKIIVRSGP